MNSIIKKDGTYLMTVHKSVSTGAIYRLTGTRSNDDASKWSANESIDEYRSGNEFREIERQLIYEMAEQGKIISIFD